MYKPDKTDSVTSLDQLSQYAKGQVVHLPDFAEGQPLVVRMTRPSLLALAKSGKIPNQLLAAATELFQGKPVQNRQQQRAGGKVDINDVMTQTYEVVKIIAEASLKEPTLQDIEGVGLQLTDEQLLAIFNYSQVGVKALDRFRSQPQYSQVARDNATVSTKAIGVTRDK